jgi:hypothetical protein
VYDESHGVYCSYASEGDLYSEAVKSQSPRFYYGLMLRRRQRKVEQLGPLSGASHSRMHSHPGMCLCVRLGIKSTSNISKNRITATMWQPDTEDLVAIQGLEASAGRA